MLTDIKSLIKLYIELNEMNLEIVQILSFSDDYSNDLELIRELIKNTESMHDTLKIIERSLR